MTEHEDENTALLTLERVRLRRGGASLFAPVTMQVNAGERVALVGGEGRGKTSLLRVLAGLQPPDEGSVRWLGRPVGSWPEAERSRWLGVCFQEPSRMLLMPSVREEVALGPEGHGVRGILLDQRVMEALAWVGIPTEVAGRMTAELPLSLQSRVALAAVLVGIPRLLLVEEPGTFLSDAGEEDLAWRLGRWQQATGATVVVLTSRISRAHRFSDRMVTLNGEEEAPP